ncbi:DUF1775 domain-containing protein [Dactylosporangium sp. NPDC049525]|uniref:DUF1775 domain-containing protein n=1 Tax=Dactylosporangium sp. NPDC049525 TaxID=3154730 RepID=UPI003444E8DC
MFKPRPFPLAGAAAAGALLGVLTTAIGTTPAGAHVTVRADNPQAGARDVTVTFTAKAESRQAGLVSERVLLPAGLSPSDLRPVSAPTGWKFTAAADGYTVSGPALRPGVDATYAIMIAQLPMNATTLAFRTLETYSDGTTNRWVDIPTSEQPEPASPAPMLTLRPATARAETSAPATAAASPAAPQAATPTIASGGKSTGARMALAVIAALAVLVTAAVIAFALTHLRRQPPTA